MCKRKRTRTVARTLTWTIGMAEEALLREAEWKLGR